MVILTPVATTLTREHLGASQVALLVSWGSRASNTSNPPSGTIGLQLT